MITTLIGSVKNYIRHTFLPTHPREKNVVEAYDIWAKNYDAQPGNLMLDIDALTLDKLLKNINLSHKKIADIGCGTGRHWQKILAEKPKELVGFDVSQGMLTRLQEKFPTAKTKQITDNFFHAIPSESFDLIISTLTLAHIKNLEPALNAWSRILKKESEIIITDFHPKTLAFGGKRTFMSENKLISVQNFIHYTYAIKSTLAELGFALIAQEEIYIDETFKHYYENKNALKVYETYKGFPILYGLHFKRLG